MRSQMMAIFCALTVGMVTAAAQGANPSANPASNQGSNINQHVVTMVHSINQGEIQLGRMMAKQSHNPRVQRFARMVARDHSQADRKLRRVAGQAGLAMQVSSRQRHKNNQMKQRLQSAGSRADHMYVTAEMRDHSKAIRRLQALRGKITDPALKNYVSQMLPQLRKHLSAARSLAHSASLQGAAGAAATPAGRAAGNQGHMPATSSPLGLLLLLGGLLGAAGWGLYRRNSGVGA